MNDPKSLFVAIFLFMLLVWMFIRGDWRTGPLAPFVPFTVLVASLTVMVILRLLGLWMW